MELVIALSVLIKEEHLHSLQGNTEAKETNQQRIPTKMSQATYDEVEIEDMTFHPELQIFTYPCPCGDRFEIDIMDMLDGENIAVCPSCSLMIDVIFEPEDLEEFLETSGKKSKSVAVTA
ncbi:hypothetical protein NCAS_0A14410 [Naumovozyma castellii]|uniref:Diphthamide biosynthesis protein 3 n=1 Tax=Naumovozyma castellii TaxID=27288 RepID=G0V949_NAUCA|nr:hypothetical protein NCAS_0A14410 [Naumovozyma castellii CBS 4309]CCC67999.1 hypothetical protein NCAS_0A14410 [Naumovozyma castellii CBS 4309]